MNKDNLKEYLNTLLLSIVAYLLIDIHLTFKTMVKDVEHLKQQVSILEHILNNEDKNNKTPNKYGNSISEAILPKENIKVEGSNEKAKHSNP